MRVAIYRRISTDEINQPYSLSAQEDRLTGFVASQGDWQIVADYQDQMSGAKMERPGLQQMLRDAKLGRFDVLLVLRVDRLARSVTALLEIIDLLTDAGVEFRSATEGFDTTDPAGRLMLNMIGSFAEFERSMIIDRVTAGMKRKAQSGGWPGGRPSIGYVLNEGQLEIDHTYASLVRHIFDRYVHQNEGSQTIAHSLNEAGHRSPTGKPFSFKQCLRILRNRVYIGEVYFQDTWYPGIHQPIIDQDLFDAAQKLLEKRSTDISTRASNRSTFLLSGIVRCMNCNRHLTGTTAHGRSRAYTYYSCAGRQRYGKTECTTERIPAPALEDAVITQLLDIFENSTLIEEATNHVQETTERNRQQLTDELSTIEAEQAKLSAALEKYLQAFENGDLSPAICGQRIEQIDHQLHSLNQRHTELQHQLDVPTEAPSEEALRQLKDNIREAVTNGNPKHQKQLLQALVHEIQVTSRNHIQPVYRIPTQNNEQHAVRALSQKVEAPGIEPRTEPWNWLVYWACHPHIHHFRHQMFHGEHTTPPQKVPPPG